MYGTGVAAGTEGWEAVVAVVEGGGVLVLDGMVEVADGLERKAEG